MKYIDINKRYTEIVAEYIRKGYSINSTSMSGSQGETSKVDLTDGSEIIRVMVATFSDWRANIEGVEISVGRVVDKNVKPHDNSDWNTIWNDKLERIVSERFYKIARNSNFYGTRAEAEAANNIRFERYIAREPDYETEDITGKAMDIAKRIISKKFGVKRIRDMDVSVIKCGGKYTVGYKGKTYKMH